MRNLLCLLAAFGFLACSIGGAPVRIVEGQRFSAQDMVQVEKGMTPAEVEGILGPPLTTAKDNGVTQWRYFFRMSKDDLIRILGFIPIRRALAIWETEAEIGFTNDRVETIRIFERRIK